MTAVATDFTGEPGTTTQFRVLASGYYGFDNLGDELILRVLTQQLQARGIHLTVLSANPDKTKLLYGIDAIKRTDLKAIIRALGKSHLFISGGGGLFQDATGMGSPVYYGGLIQMAAFMEVPVFFWSQGIGPLNRPLSRWLTGKALKKCRMITVRDNESAQWVQRLASKPQAESPKPQFPEGFEITADPVWLLNMPEPQNPALTEPGYTIGISLRPWSSLTPERIEAFAKYLVGLECPEGSGSKRILLFSFQPDADQKPLELLAEALKVRNFTQIHWVQDTQILETMGLCQRFYGMRFHSLILSLLAGVPVMGLIYDPKVMALVENLKLQGIGVGNLEEITEHVKEEAFVSLEPERLADLKHQAGLNVEKIVQLLEQTQKHR